jgi:YCII-related domain
MPTFVFAYRAPKDYTPGSPDTVAAWAAWFDNISESVVDIGKPVFEEPAVLGQAGTDTRLGGYSIVSADDLESAVALAKGCPYLEGGGGVEVGQLADVPNRIQP